MSEPILGRSLKSQRAFLRGLFDKAVAATHPAQTLPAFLPAAPKHGRILLLSTGKAGGSMMSAAVHHYCQTLGIDPKRLFGVGSARHGYEDKNPVIPMISAGHPMPDAGSVEAARQAIHYASQTTPNDIAVVLMSGGGSANWLAPAGNFTLEEKQALNKALLRSGAHIGEMNCVRKHLSQIKGGRLAAKMAAGRIYTLAISDVPGDDPSTIASGPTVPDETTQQDALDILAKYKIALPEHVLAILNDPANETPKPGNPIFERCQFDIISRPRDALEAAIREAKAAGYNVHSLGPDVEGEARDVASQHAKMALEMKALGKPTVILSGGELTVTMRGQGTGGPNQEYALALAMALQSEKGITALAADTDGTDGGKGDPTDPAGALVDETSLARAKQAGLDPARSLAQNDSTPFFQALDDLIQTGPTLTNANDLRAILVTA
jgi:glycerate 2-kinase